jgi:ABC-type histidine transport system ATPase subunit
MRALADEGRTMIVVTHEIGFARDVSNKVIFLHEGAIESEGAPIDMFGNPDSARFRQFLSNALH